MLAFSHILNVPDQINTHPHKFLKCLPLDPILNWIAMHKSTPLEQRWGCWYFFCVIIWVLSPKSLFCLSSVLWYTLGLWLTQWISQLLSSIWRKITVICWCFICLSLPCSLSLPYSLSLSLYLSHPGHTSRALSLTSKKEHLPMGNSSTLKFNYMPAVVCVVMCMCMRARVCAPACININGWNILCS